MGNAYSHARYAKCPECGGNELYHKGIADGPCLDCLEKQMRQDSLRNKREAAAWSKLVAYIESLGAPTIALKQKDSIAVSVGNEAIRLRAEMEKNDGEEKE